jgi:hypothetical protein
MLLGFLCINKISGLPFLNTIAKIYLFLTKEERKMRRFITILFMLSILFSGIAGPALAQPTPGPSHNCAGAVTSSLAGPGFGQLVAGFAHLQLVDNFGLANCGNTSGNNP